MEDIDMTVEEARSAAEWQRQQDAAEARFYKFFKIWAAIMVVFTIGIVVAYCII